METERILDHYAESFERIRSSSIFQNSCSVGGLFGISVRTNLRDRDGDKA